MNSKIDSLESLEPSLLLEEYVFCTFKNAKYGDYLNLNPIGSFQEKEGLTLVITKQRAEQESLKYQELFKCISLGLESTLISVGLTAQISTILTKSNISANMFAGYFHDHIFVPIKDAENALKILCNEQFKQ